MTIMDQQDQDCYMRKDKLNAAFTQAGVGSDFTNKGAVPKTKQDW